MVLLVLAATAAAEQLNMWKALKYEEEERSHTHAHGASFLLNTLASTGVCYTGENQCGS